MKLTKWTKRLPLRYKLAMYFLTLACTTIALLWIFQIMFLEGFYKTIKSTRVEQAAHQISLSIKNGENVTEIIDNVSRKNSLSVYIYDTSTPIFLKMYSQNYNNVINADEFQEHRVYRYYKDAWENGGTYMDTTTLESDIQELEKYMQSINSQFNNDRQEEMFQYSPQHIEYRYENLVYAEIIPVDDSTEYFMLINSTITPVSSVVETLRIQLIIVSAIVVLIVIVLSLYSARRISRPLSEMNKSAKELAKQNYDVEFNSSGYLEVNELNDTLNYTRKELSKVENLRRELIANISHDLRTPLTMIKGYGEVMRDLPGENTPENVQIIIDEASRLSTLVTDLLDLSKLQSGVLTLDASVFCLTDSIENIFKRYSKLKEQDGYTIEFESNQDVLIYGDELKMSQVIYNLMNNAINYVGEDKTVIVKQIVENKKVRIEVIDHGVGIPQDKLEYIWDRYYKVDKMHKSAVIGTGLGLSIVKNILDLHNANYGVISEEGKGSTFWFEIDIHKTVE